MMADDESKFRLFKRIKVNNSPNYYNQLLIFLILISSIDVVTTLYQSVHYYYFIHIAYLLVGLRNICGWVYLYSKVYTKARYKVNFVSQLLSPLNSLIRQYYDIDNDDILMSIELTLEDWFAHLIIISTSATILLESNIIHSIENCPNNNSIFQSCADKPLLHVVNLCMLLLSPLLIGIVLKSISLSTIKLSTFITISISIYDLLTKFSWEIFYITFFSNLIIIFILSELRASNWELYMLSKSTSLPSSSSSSSSPMPSDTLIAESKQQYERLSINTSTSTTSTTTENHIPTNEAELKILIEEKCQTQMKMYIGNVAHDFKTVCGINNLYYICIVTI